MFYNLSFSFYYDRIGEMNKLAENSILYGVVCFSY